MALLAPFFLDTVVAIGVDDDPAKRKWIGTGFLYGNAISSNPPETPTRYRLWLITNKHVLRKLSAIHVKFNSAQDTTSADYAIPLISRNKKPFWIGHPNDDTDIAAIFLNAEFLHSANRRFAFFCSDQHCITKAEMKAQGLTEGDRCFALGFPMGLVSPQRQYVICRSGVIARIRDYLDGHTHDYLVDAAVFPGNSGGPVILCPSAVAITGTTAVSRSALIGIIKTYVPYIDVAISPQTGRARVTFEENSGLSAVEPLDAIVETVALAEKRLYRRIAQAKHKAKKASEKAAEVTSDETRNPETV